MGGMFLPGVISSRRDTGRSKVLEALPPLRYHLLDILPPRVSSRSRISKQQLPCCVLDARGLSLNRIKSDTTPPISPQPTARKKPQTRQKAETKKIHAITIYALGPTPNTPSLDAHAHILIIQRQKKTHIPRLNPKGTINSAKSRSKRNPYKHSKPLRLWSHFERLLLLLFLLHNNINLKPQALA